MNSQNLTVEDLARMQRNTDAIEAAKNAEGITEEVKTWYGWKESGRIVKHGSKNVFQVLLETATPGKSYIASFFMESQTVAA